MVFVVRNVILRSVLRKRFVSFCIRGLWNVKLPMLSVECCECWAFVVILFLKYFCIKFRKQ